MSNAIPPVLKGWAPMVFGDKLTGSDLMFVTGQHPHNASPKWTPCIVLRLTPEGELPEEIVEQVARAQYEGVHGQRGVG